jgi:hypothetical protein
MTRRLARTPGQLSLTGTPSNPQLRVVAGD